MEKTIYWEKLWANRGRPPPPHPPLNPPLGADWELAGFYPETSWGEYSPQTSEIPPKILGLSWFLCDFYVAGKMNRYCIAARLSSKSNL